MEALFVKENFNIRWVAQTGFVENINSILKEYKQSRGLLVTTIAYAFLASDVKRSPWNSLLAPLYLREGFHFRTSEHAVHICLVSPVL